VLVWASDRRSAAVSAAGSTACDRRVQRVVFGLVDLRPDGHSETASCFRPDALHCPGFGHVAPIAIRPWRLRPAVGKGGD